MLTPWVGRIIFLNVAVFLAGKFVPGFESIEEALVLRPAWILNQPWTLVSYMFLHAGFGHLFFNMLSLYIFGPRLEAHLGGTRFLGLYMISGISGGLLSCLFSPAPVVGASGAILGVMYGFARYWPRERIMVYFVVLEAWVAVLLFVALDLFGGFGAGGDNIAHFAHLGGVASAFLYLQVTDRVTPRKKLPAEPRAPRVSRGDLTRWSRIQRDGLHEVNRDEFDRIMRKIEEEGVGSITTRERAFLDTFSDRVGPS